MTNEEPKSIADLRIALGRQTLRADKAERQVRDLTAENQRMRRLIGEKQSEGGYQEAMSNPKQMAYIMEQLRLESEEYP